MDPRYFILLFTIALCVLVEPSSGIFFHHKKKSGEANVTTTYKPTTVDVTAFTKEYERNFTSDKNNLGSDKESEEISSPNATYYNGKNCQQVAESLKLSAFLKHLKDAGLTDHLIGKEETTIFAPSNHAFGSMDFRAKNIFAKNKEHVKMVMSYHISKGKVIKTTDMKNEQLLDTLNGTRKLRLNIYPNEKERNKTLIYTATGAKIGKPNNVGSNCVIHIVKSVLLKYPDNHILDTLSKISKFKTFYEEIMKHADISKLLSGDGPYTVFAPIQQAFDKNSAKERISSEDILKTHIVAGTYFTPDFLNDPELTSLQGPKLQIHYKKSIIADMMLINNSTLFETDIPATNGVIHAINKVL